jgi:hypothetical protein
MASQKPVANTLADQFARAQERGKKTLKVWTRKDAREAAGRWTS